jgi:predicted metal-binding membrane protein
MAGMDAGPGTNPGALGFFLSTWIVMMAAMMLPAVMPMVLAYRAARHERRGHDASTNPGDTGLFLAGYLAVWAVAGLLGYALLEAGRHLDGGLFAWDRAGRFIAAGVLVAAALYQLTPSKNTCLSRCRSRHAFLLEGWRDGHDGALRIGMEHGAWCLGCCWALMAALFALGAMSIAWMALISILITAERLLPWRAPATIGVASLLVVVAIGVAAAPARVPMLTIPHSGAAMQAMGASPARHMQFVLADGGSTDRTHEIIRRAAAEDPGSRFTTTRRCTWRAVSTSRSGQRAARGTATARTASSSSWIPVSSAACGGVTRCSSSAAGTTYGLAATPPDHVKAGRA